MSIRKEYMAKKVTHREYYGQFANGYVKELVLRRFKLKRLLQSKDEHLNDIPLREWDNLAICIPDSVKSAICKANESGVYSLSDGVCTVKEAAKQVIEEN